MFAAMSLRFAEEILLLALDHKTGKLHPLPERALDLAVAGALLMELAFDNRVDTDQKNLMVVDRSPGEDPLLAQVLASLPADVDQFSISQALANVSDHSHQWKQALFQSLVERGILRQEEHRFLFVLKERRYPAVDDKEEREVMARIREIILTKDAIPDPRDVVIICLMDACDLSTVVFSDQELEQCRGRIKDVSKMDFIGQALAQAIRDIQEAIFEVIAYSGM